MSNFCMFYLFFVFFLTEAVLPQLLYALCSGPETPIEHLERQQVTKKLKLNSNKTLHQYVQTLHLGKRRKNPYVGKWLLRWLL